jgi:hypothetical protein
MKPHFTAAEMAQQIAFAELFKQPVGTDIEGCVITYIQKEGPYTPRSVWFRDGLVNDPSWEKRKAAEAISPQ